MTLVSRMAALLPTMLADMEAGLVLGLHVTAELTDRSGVTLLVTGDEEIGSPSSRALIEAEAVGCAAALVLEASADGGALKTERKGVSLYQAVRGGRPSTRWRRAGPGGHRHAPCGPCWTVRGSR
jgi:acetylornithine deacetylase/succinyl-diaminopimelate desuccinylase-like protein